MPLLAATFHHLQMLQLNRSVRGRPRGPGGQLFQIAQVLQNGRIVVKERKPFAEHIVQNIIAPGDEGITHRFYLMPQLPKIGDLVSLFVLAKTGIPGNPFLLSTKPSDIAGENLQVPAGIAHLLQLPHALHLFHVGAIVKHRVVLEFAEPTRLGEGKIGADVPRIHKLFQ